ncbi:MAG: hypothetical protein M3447_07890 [Acidobacteriota bacterium]|nr:hypothetical protein [Acidobacteriota bacterium]
MSPKPRRTNLSLILARTGGVLLTLCCCAIVLGAELPRSKRLSGAVICRTELNLQRREELAARLRKISGWPDLRFDDTGILRPGRRNFVGGSRSARELLTKVMLGTSAVVLEDASRNSDVVFMRAVPGQWKTTNGPPAFVIQIDFVDFEQVTGDEPALEAFDTGWALLHELDHIAHNSLDATAFDEIGECEQRVNQMRLECNLPQRVDYFYTFSPLTRNSTFATRLVRLAFEEAQLGGKKRRYWIVWDANLVGGLDRQKELAELR